MIKINRSMLLTATYTYLLIPIIIFFCGWLKPIIAFFCIICLLVGFSRIYRTEREKELNFCISYNVLITLAAVILIWMFFAGCGGFLSVQRSDLHWRNATFRDLIEYSWPVIYPETKNALVYYFVFWMVPALVGKIFGFTAANAMLFLWIFLGIFLTIIYLCLALQVKSVRELSVLLLVFIVWGGKFNWTVVRICCDRARSRLEYIFCLGRYVYPWITIYT